MAELPVPKAQVSPDNEVHFNGLEEGRLLLPLCNSCEHVFWYPRRRCPLCGSPDVGWSEASRRGSIYSFTIVRRAEGAYARSVPYVLAYVELEEGVRLMTNLVGVNDPSSLEIGQAVEAVFELTEGSPPALRFRPVKDRPPPARGPVQGLRSDSRAGEGVVQVNDNQLRDPDPEEDEALLEEQHPTGG